MSRKALETLEFRGVLIVLAIVAGLVIYISLFTGHRPKVDDERVPTVPAGDAPPPSRL